MKEEEIDILTLIPQRPPFVMVDRLLHFDTQTTITEFEVRADNIFIDDGKLSSEGIVENIAQTCAARMGFINLHVHGEHVKLGFIGSAQEFSTPSSSRKMLSSLTVKLVVVTTSS